MIKQVIAFWRRLTMPLLEPYFRYQYADILHAIRLGSAVVGALLVNKLTQFPHGEWTTITVFVILGLLQYQGAIYTKAKERILGTLFGIMVGLGLLWLSPMIGGYQWLYYVLIGVISGMIGYFAVRQLGYIGLLTGITMCMVISTHGSTAEGGMYRALNVLLGTGFAVVATMILPLKSTLMWRFLLARNLEACAHIYQEVGAYIDVDFSRLNQAVATGQASQTTPKNYVGEINLNGWRSHEHERQEHLQRGNDDRMLEVADMVAAQTQIDGVHTPIADELVAELKRINKRLIAVRPHLAPTASESGIDKERLETIQRTHRNIIGTIDLLLTTAPRLANIGIDEDNHVLLIHYQHELTHAMHHISAVLRSPSDEEFRPITRIQVSEYPSIHNLAFEWQGYFWLTQTLQSQLQYLSDLLKQSKPKWYLASGLRYQRRELKRLQEQGSYVKSQDVPE